jgi:hypothetical protein
MSENTIRLRDFTGPQNKEVGAKLMGMVNRLSVHQATATDANLALADKNAVPVCLEAGKIRDLWVMFAGAALAAAETMSVDIHKSTDNGATYATILSAPKVFTNTTGTLSVRHSLMALLADPSVGLSDRLRVVLDYTAGGGPTPVTSTVVVCDIAPAI